MTENDLGIKGKEQVFWEEVLKDAKAELEKVEENYYKAKTFNTEVIKMCESKIDAFR